MGKALRFIFGVLLIWMGLAHLTTFFSFGFMYEPIISVIVTTVGLLLIFISKETIVNVSGGASSTRRNPFAVIFGILTLIIGILQIVYYFKIALPFTLPVISETALPWILILIGATVVFAGTRKGMQQTRF